MFSTLVSRYLDLVLFGVQIFYMLFQFVFIIIIWEKGILKAYFLLFILFLMMMHAGKNCFIWNSTVPSVIIMNPEHLRDIFNSYDDFRKPTINHFIRYISDGIILDDGERWAKRRKIINPAFHLLKLKVFH